jgi:hypothetical protein
MPGELLVLRIHAERLVVGDDHLLRRVPPATAFLRVDAVLTGAVGGPGTLTAQRVLP